MIVHKRILLVDDEPAIVEELCELLNLLDYDVTGAGGVDEALHAVIDDPDITLIITDVRMPGRDGIELVRELSSRKDREFEFIVISGHFDSDDEMAGLSRLPVKLLRKPVSVDALEAALMELRFMER